VFPAASTNITSAIPFHSPHQSTTIRAARSSLPTTPISTHSFQSIQPRIHLHASPPPTHTQASHQPYILKSHPLTHSLTHPRATEQRSDLAYVRHEPHGLRRTHFTSPIPSRIVYLPRLAVVSTQIRAVRIYLHVRRGSARRFGARLGQSCLAVLCIEHDYEY
jgi:hypothetical protein